MNFKNFEELRSSTKVELYRQMHNTLKDMFNLIVNTNELCKEFNHYSDYDFIRYNEHDFGLDITKEYSKIYTKIMKMILLIESVIKEEEVL